MKTTPLVVAFEGIDYAGKSTLIDGLRAMIHRDGRPVPPVFAEPRKDTQEWRDIRKMVISPTIPKVGQIHMSVASRVSLYQDHIVKELKEGKLVFTDRCVLTSMVYQQDENHGDKEILDFNTRAGYHLEHNVVPDIVVYLEIDHDTYMSRLGRNRTETEDVETFISDPVNFQTYLNRYFDALKSLRNLHGTKMIFSNDPEYVYEQLKALGCVF